MTGSPMFARTRPQSAAPRSGLRQRFAPLLARLRGGGLDRELAAGRASWDSPLLAARARYLTSEHTRRMIARSLEKAVEGVDGHSRRQLLTPAIPTTRTGVMQARPQLLQIAGRLRSGAPVQARGVAVLMRLLTDGSSPLYRGAGAAALPAALTDAANHLQARD